MVFYNPNQALPMYDEAHQILQGISGLFGEVHKVFTTDIPAVFQGQASVGIQAREAIVRDKFDEVDVQIQELMKTVGPDEMQSVVDLDRALGE